MALTWDAAAKKWTLDYADGAPGEARATTVVLKPVQPDRRSRFVVCPTCRRARSPELPGCCAGLPAVEGRSLPPQRVSYALWRQGDRRRFCSPAPVPHLRDRHFTVWRSASTRSSRRSARSVMGSGGRSSGRWCASYSSAAISSTASPASVAPSAARSSFSCGFPAGAVVSARVAPRNGSGRRRAGSASTFSPRGLTVSWCPGCAADVAAGSSRFPSGWASTSGSSAGSWASCAGPRRAR